MSQSAAIAQIMLNSFAAMTKVFIVASVGFISALYPRNDPYLSSQALKYVSKISNNICLPALIISSIGSGLSFALLSRMGILILFSMFTSMTSYFLAATIGKWIDNNSSLYISIYVAIASPNIVSLPLMVLQTLCNQSIVNADYDGDSIQCFTESSTMIFIYSIGWHLVYWSYGFPLLQSLQTRYLSHSTKAKNISLKVSQRVSYGALPTSAGGSDDETRENIHESDEHIVTEIETKDTSHATLSKLPTDPLSSSTVEKKDDMTLILRIQKFSINVLLSPVMVSIYIGVFIGLVTPLRVLMFQSMSPVRPLGDALTTIGKLEVHRI